MSDRLIYAYAADIVKSTQNDDGSITVYGKAAGNDLDLDEQRCDPAWLKSAMADWFSRWGNIREGHDPHRAIGVATELESLDNADQFITAKVVDPLAVTKINEKVLKGFSIGIKGARIRKAADAPAGLICGGTIVETSVVDNASNQTCKFVVAKAVGNDVVANHWDAEPIDTADVDAIRAEIIKVAGAATAAPALAHLASRDQTLTKHATPDQAALLATAMRNVSKLIASEASEMASTGRDEINDLRLLLDAVSALKWFSISEANEPEEDDMTNLTLAAFADIAKAATPEDRAAVAALFTGAAPPLEDKTKAAEPDEEGASAPLDGEALKTDIIDAVKAALAETTKGLADQLAEVKKMAAPGGPMRMASGITKGTEADDKASQRAYYLRQANTVDDPTLAAGYRAKADALR